MALGRVSSSAGCAARLAAPRLLPWPWCCREANFGWRLSLPCLAGGVRSHSWMQKRAQAPTSPAEILRVLGFWAVAVSGGGGCSPRSGATSRCPVKPPASSAALALERPLAAFSFPPRKLANRGHVLAKPHSPAALISCVRSEGPKALEESCFGRKGSYFSLLKSPSPL